jgi:SAM-dependent methyltransferase
MASMSALAAYEAALRVGSGITAHTRGGQTVQLPVDQWLDDPSPCDREIVALCHGSTLEVGCGPGRLTRALLDEGRPALGVDVSAEAVHIARSRGARAVERDVFAAVPREGRWDHVLLADGSIGIGGDPARLLRRCRAIARPDGSVVAEIEPPGGRDARGDIRVSAHGHDGWLPWAWVSAETIGAWALLAGLGIHRTVVTRAGRHAVELRAVESGVPRSVV